MVSAFSHFISAFADAHLLRRYAYRKMKMKSWNEMADHYE